MPMRKVLDVPEAGAAEAAVQIDAAEHLGIIARVVRRTRGLVPWVDQSDLEDVAQLALVEAARDFRGECDFGAYAYNRVRCAVLNELKAWRLRVGGREEFPEDVGRQPDYMPRHDIYEALKALPPREYRVVMLFFWGRKTQSEIAIELSVSRPRVAQILASAEKNMRDALTNRDFS